MSARQAAVLAGVDERELRRRIQRGELVAFKQGRAWRIRIADLEAAGLNVRHAVDASGAAAAEARAQAAERQVSELLRERAELRRALAEARRGLALLHATPVAGTVSSRRGRFGLRRRKQAFDWQVVAGMLHVDDE